MKYKLEKFVRMATLEELLASRKPDFKARNEIRTLRRHNISADYERKDENTYRVIAYASEVPEINYLVLKRGFEKVIEKPKIKPYSDVVKTILKRPRNGAGGGIPLTRGEVAMLFFDGYAGDSPPAGGGVDAALGGRGGGRLDIRSQGYGDDDDWYGLSREDIFSTDEDTDAAFIWSKWEPLELWPNP